MPIKNNKQTIEKYNWSKTEEAKIEEFEVDTSTTDTQRSESV